MVVLDFTSVEIEGQSFADDIFRVFATLHPEVEIAPVNMNEAVRRMVSRAISHS